MKAFYRYLSHLFVLCVFAGAVWLLYHKLKSYSFAQILESVDKIPVWRLWLSVALMGCNYAILVGYDWLALIAIHKRLSLRRTAFVSFIGQAVSYNFGALLGGTAVRYRLYSAWGFKLEEIVRLVFMLAVTFWVGVFGLCGVVLLVSPPQLPPELADILPSADMRILGVALLCLASLYFVLCAYARHPITIFGKRFVLPPLRIALAQAAVAFADLIVAAACLYVLISDINVSFWAFLPDFVLAQVAVVLSHVPGGVGVFELVIVHMTQGADERNVVAALLCFRVIYMLLPLLLAALLLLVYELRLRRHTLLRGLRTLWRTWSGK